MPICSYPNSQFIFKSVQGCKDIYRFAVPWKDAINCGWNSAANIQEEGFKVYKGQVVVVFHEWQNNIGEWRRVQSILRIKIRFQRYVQVTIAQDPTIFGNKITNAAITKQIVAIDLGSPALVELVTTLTYPFKLEKGDLTLTPPGKVSNHTFSSVDCAVTQGVVCRQRWAATLQLNADTCTLDGNYKMDWKVACGAGLTGANCPLNPTIPDDVDASTGFSLTSENFCAEVGVEVSLRGTLASYEDSGFTVAKSAFIVGRTAYFLVKVNSEINPAGDYVDATANVKFGTANLKLVSVTVRQVTSTSVINRVFEKGAIAVGDPLKTQCTQISISVSSVGFSLNFSKELSQTLVNNGKLTFTIGAEVQVSYVQSKKRGLLQATPNDEKATYNTDNDLSGVEFTTTPASTETATTGNGFVVAISFALLLLSLLM
jgi:hypothetical protein